MAVFAVVAMDDTPLFHLAVPCEVLGADRADDGLPRHDVRVARAGRGPLHSSNGVVLQAPYGLEALDDADVVIVPWWGRIAGQPLSPRLLEALRRARARGARVAGLCGGAFVLAEAGLLDGKRATTHWKYAADLAADYPRVQVEAQVLYVDEGDVLTSAGTAAAIDLCLHLLRSVSGAEAANAVARRMVVPPHRAGGQAQYVDVPVPEIHAADGVATAMEWALEHLDWTMGVEELAAHAAMSRRTFTRQFRQRTGTSALQWLLQQRTLLAQRLLETTDLSVEVVARRSGFGSAVTLRAHFQRALGTTPRDYRATFSREAHQVLERIAAD